MKITRLSELIKEGALVGGKFTVDYLNAPKADELIAAIGINTLPFHLKPIGIYNLDGMPFFICSRTDCGVFWRGVAVAKYKLLFLKPFLWHQFLKIMHSLGMLIVPNGRRTDWRDLQPDFLLFVGAIASVELFAISLSWFILGGYSLSIISLLAALATCWGTGIRKNYCVERRDRISRKINEILLRSSSLGFEVELERVRVTGFFMDEVEITFRRTARATATFDRLMEVVLNEVNRYWVSPEAYKEANQLTPCLYYNRSRYLSCAVHPDHKENGLCNEQCPSFEKMTTNEK